MMAPGAPTTAMREPGTDSAPASKTPVVRAPGHDEPLPAVDERIVAPEGRFEAIDGQVIECAPAEEPHGRAHSNVDFVIRAHTKPSFAVAVDMLTRANRFSDLAPDISVFPEARDPNTGGRQVEHIAIEVRDTQALSDVTAKARLLHQRGVRRVLCLDLPKSRVLAWNATQDEWDELPLSSNITDRTCFVRAIPVRALLDAAVAENAAAAALLSKKNPVLESARAHDREEAREEGREEGVQALRRAVEDMCRLLGVELNDRRCAQLANARLVELEQLRISLVSTRRWPS